MSIRNFFLLLEEGGYLNSSLSDLPLQNHIANEICLVHLPAKQLKAMLRIRCLLRLNRQEQGKQSNRQVALLQTFHIKYNTHKCLSKYISKNYNIDLTEKEKQPQYFLFLGNYIVKRKRYLPTDFKRYYLQNLDRHEKQYSRYRSYYCILGIIISLYHAYHQAQYSDFFL